MNHRVTSYEELIEAQKSATLTYVGKKIEDQLAEELDHVNEEMSQIALPDSLEHKIRRIIKDEEKSTQKQKRKIIIGKFSKACAIFLVGIFLIGTFTLVNVEAVRVKVFGLFSNKNQEYIQINPVKMPEDDSRIIPKNWEGYWYPKYVPQGYILSAAEDNASKKDLYYKSGNQVIQFHQSTAENSGYAVDNEHGENKTIDWNDITGYWHKEDGKASLIWIQSNCSFMLDGSFELEEAIKIAESITYQK